jgi:hypothetical protein
MLIITSYEDGVTEVMIHHVGNGSFEETIVHVIGVSILWTNKQN